MKSDVIAELETEGPLPPETRAAILRAEKQVDAADRARTAAKKAKTKRKSRKKLSKASRRRNR